MVDKNNKAKANKQSFEDSSPPKKKYRLIILSLILGIAVLISLYLNFQTSYQSSESKSTIKANPSEAIITKNTSIPAQQNTYNEDKQQVIDSEKTQQVIDSKKTQQESEDTPPPSQAQCSQPCTALLQFTQDYFSLKTDLIMGNDFANQLINLTQYTIKSEDLKQSLINLLNLSKHNHNYRYFRDKFKGLIKPLYKHSKQFFTIDLKDYVFIRKIDDRAMRHDDLDKVVFVVLQALENNDLISALKNLNELPQNVDFISLFKQEIEDQVDIENNIANIENILLNKPDCSIVSK